MPITIARIIGLKVAIPGIRRVRRAATAMAPVSNSPGRIATAPANRVGATLAGPGAGSTATDEISVSAAIVIEVAPGQVHPNIGRANQLIQWIIIVEIIAFFDQS
jgi:hypothetical protein